MINVLRHLSKVSQLTVQNSSIDTIAVLLDQTITCGSEGNIKIWNPNSNNLIRTLNIDRGKIESLAVIEESSLVNTNFDNTITVWNPMAGEFIRELKGHVDRVVAVIVLKENKIASG